MYVCMYVRTYVRTYVYMYVCVCVCACVCVCVCMHICTYVRTYVCVCITYTRQCDDCLLLNMMVWQSVLAGALPLVWAWQRANEHEGSIV